MTDTVTSSDDHFDGEDFAIGVRVLPAPSNGKEFAHNFDSPYDTLLATDSEIDVESRSRRPSAKARNNRRANATTAPAKPSRVSERLSRRALAPVETKLVRSALGRSRNVSPDSAWGSMLHPLDSFKVLA